MLHHILKMAWKRKKANSLILLELLAAFLVLVAVSAILLHNWGLYNKPLGFNYKNTWSVQFQPAANWEETTRVRGVNILNMLSQMDEIDSAYTLTFSPFVSMRWNDDITYKGRVFNANLNGSSDGAPAGIGMKLLQGRWYGPEDDGQHYQAVVINKNLSDELFGNENPIGIELEVVSSGQEASQVRRVVGVFEDYRQQGEFSTVSNQMFLRFDVNDTEAWFWSYALVMKPGVPAEFEEKLMSQLNGAAPNWDFEVQTWSKLRRVHIVENMKSVVLVAIIGGFLMLMVCFGLFGVLWQNVTRRTREIGLRRALGATGNNVQGMIIMELVAFAILAVIVGTILLAQVPLLGVFEIFTWSMFFKSVALSAVLICTLTALCALYPGWMAAKYDPAEALHFE
jgi:putative ABC transport system permease protein